MMHALGIRHGREILMCEYGTDIRSARYNLLNFESATVLAPSSSFCIPAADRRGLKSPTNAKRAAVWDVLF